MREFVALTDTAPFMRAWLYPENPQDDEIDPFAFREDGWRIVIEKCGDDGNDELVRSTWDQSLEEILRHMEIYWPGRAVWRDHATGQIVELDRGGAGTFE